MPIKIIIVLAKMFKHLFRRGSSIFKLLFIIDDFFRVFTMTILIPLLISWLKLGPVFIVLGTLLGLAIDIHDFIEEMGVAKIGG